MYHTLGVNLVLSAPAKETVLKILREVWKVVSALTDPADYIKCAEVYIEIPAKHLTAREVDMLLTDIIAYMSKNRTHERFLPQLQSIVEKILTAISDVNAIFSMARRSLCCSCTLICLFKSNIQENFMPLLDLFQSNPTIRNEVCKFTMQHFARHQGEEVSDVVRVNTIMFVAKTLHDSVNALTFEDEKRQYTELILSFIRKVTRVKCCNVH